MLKIGIVGLPNVGKSTLFNALTKTKQADAQNYPFCTIEPNIGIISVPDQRLKPLAEISHSQKIVPTAIEFVDIAGLVKGASEGEGRGNQFLSHIREVDAIAQVVRAFEDEKIIHVHNRVDPKEDAEIINLELILADWQIASKRLEAAKKTAKNNKESAEEAELLEKICQQLEKGKPARELNLEEKEKRIIKSLGLLTLKPMIYAVNLNEKQINDPEMEKFLNESLSGAPFVKICAKTEEDLSELSETEAEEYLKESGITQTGLDQLINQSYRLLDLITFFTSGEPETRAWTVRRHAKAPEAAGVIHTDFIKGFIKAEVTNYEDFISCNGWSGVKEKGKMRLEGKDYEVQDGDVCYFHVNTR